MGNIAIQVEKLSKLYRLGQVGTGTLNHDFQRWWAQARGKEDPFAKIGQLNDRTQKAQSDYMWALKDLNFDVRKGEVLGIIGANGAGKSTLLKILSKITSPTSGFAITFGRIASLLEVGTGFHPEMTGRENIFLNGAILGMRRHEIVQKFDAIVDFAGVEAYIDTPVKRYSSGMYVRLAFAVAAYLEPEILIVDEILAVGDAEFQRKCIGRMKDVSINEGRTVLFVSHNMAAVKNLCDRVMLLMDGQIESTADTDIDKVIRKYYETQIKGKDIRNLSSLVDRGGNGEAHIMSLEMMNSNNDYHYIESGSQIGFSISYGSMHTNLRGRVLLSINTMNGECILFLDSHMDPEFPLTLNKTGSIEVYVSGDFTLPIGKYFVNVAFQANGIIADHIQGVLQFEVVDGLFFESGKIPLGKSLCLVKHKWTYVGK